MTSTLHNPTTHQASQQITASIIRHLIYPLWAKRDHPAYASYSKDFTRNQYLSASELNELQTNRLRSQLVHAYRNIPFYRHRMESAGITPLDICSIHDLSLLPVLTKRDIQDHGAEMLATNIPEEARVRNQTGGSTGSPLQFWVDKERFDSRRASTDRHNSWAGLRPGDWCAELWGTNSGYWQATVLPTVTWRHRLLYRTLTLNTSSVCDSDFDAYVEILRRYRPRYMVAYAQAAALFAAHCRARGYDDIRFDSVITTAEVLLPASRAIIEDAFRTQVFNRYGSRETSVIASECEYHTGMHVNADALIVEIEPVAGLPEGLGRVLVTDLLNRSMPLIRYEIGDLAVFSDTGTCSCGRSFPRLERVEGRTTDFLVLPDGHRISGPSLALIVGGTAEVRQAQFVQIQPDRILLKVVPGRGYSSDTDRDLHRKLDPYLRGEAVVSIVCVDGIPTEPSGKYRFVKAAEEVGAL